jgi:hypothetical protein
MCLIFSYKEDFYMNSGVSKVRTYQSFNNIQYGYIVLPKDVDRDNFIEQCYRWERVSILIERGGGLLNECYITKNAIAEISFPLTYDTLGSCVLLLTDPFSGLPVIFGVLSKEDESQLLQEGVFKLAKKWQDSGVTISGDAKKGVINISVNGGTTSQLNISVTNTDKTATVNLRCNGDINIVADGHISEVVGDSLFALHTEGFNFNTGAYGLKKTLADLCDKLLASKVLTVGGPAIFDPETITALTLIKTELNAYLK